MFYDGIPKANHVWILSCSSPRASAWLITQLVLSTFWLSSPKNFIMFQTQLGILHLQLHASFDVCAHIPLTLWVSTSYVTPMATSARKPMIQFTTFFPSLCEMFVSTWDENITCTSFKYIQLLSLTNQHCVHEKWNLHFSDVVITDPTHAKKNFMILYNSKICYL